MKRVTYIPQRSVNKYTKIVNIIVMGNNTAKYIIGNCEKYDNTEHLYSDIRRESFEFKDNRIGYAVTTTVHRDIEKMTFLLHEEGKGQVH
jgi:hypothetical protein